MKQKYIQLQKQLTEGTDLAALETDVYSALYSFFNRYYDDGDFISKRRYKEGVYAIPYEGEEVKLYWANQDQYCIVVEHTGGGCGSCISRSTQCLYFR